ncbi:Ig-like domain-containing protein [Sulfidibacter corallicola]|uniref:Ig-like domain-containing protein n=1 Tax=Sulfidibacter corallicola TaxID=2818388 RepID=A0A8A4TPZ0_SULCO|nr:Ig-like domain-containing protein [Sulfidibacter corallicola]QTD51048.1 Ig-like domain-containing protein [Sulfidibacter corallicola]
MFFRSARFPSAAILILVAITMWTCSDDDEGPSDPLPSFTFVKFDVTTGNPADIALPNDILRDPATGLVNLPLEGEPFESANTLQGFSTLANIILPFEGAVDPSTVSAETLPIFNTAAFPPTPANVAYQTVTDPATGASTVVAVPLTPLAPGTTYIGVVTRGVLDPTGQPVESQLNTMVIKGSDPIDPNASTAPLESLRQLYQPIWEFAEGVMGTNRVNIPFAWAFTTQPLFDTQRVLRRRAANAAPTPTVDVPLPSGEAVDQFFQSMGLGAVPHEAIGSMYKGTFSSTNYIAHPLAGPFVAASAEQAAQLPDVNEGEPLPISANAVSFWAALPAGAQGPVPTVIFQHGLGRSKEDMFAIANSLCGSGFGVIGIDMVLHGERTMDFLDNETGAILPEGDGIPDPSGSNFINLGNPRMTRDNAKQGLSDQLNLAQMVKTGQTDFNGDGTADLSTSFVYLGQSLGALFGSVFSTLEEDLSVAVLNVPGARLGSLLPNSPILSPSINAGLAANGIQTGSAEYNLFWLIFQTVLDDADPMNYAPHLLNGGLKESGTATQVLLQEAFEDQVIPNSATQDLTRAMGIPQVNASWVYPGHPQVEAPRVGSGHFQFQDAEHGFLLSPTDPSVVPGQLQAITYLATALQGQPTIIDPFQAGKRLLDRAVPFERTPTDLRFVVVYHEQGALDALIR